MNGSKQEKIGGGIPPERMKELKMATVAKRLTEIVKEEGISPTSAFKEYIRRSTGSGDVFFENFEKFFSRTFDIPIRSERIAEAEISSFYKFLNPAAASPAAFQQPRGEGFPESEPFFRPELFEEIKKKMQSESINSGEALASIIKQRIGWIADKEERGHFGEKVSVQKHFNIFERVIREILIREKNQLTENQPAGSVRLLYLLYYPENYLELFSTAGTR